MKKLLLTLLIVFSVMPMFAYAQTAQTTSVAPFCNGGTCTYVPLEPLPGQVSQNGVPQNLTFAQYVSNIFTIAIVIGGMVTVAVLVFAGITYMVSEAIPQKDWGRRKVKQALWALLLLLGSYLILTTINPNLVIFNFTGATIGTGVATQTCGAATNSSSVNPLQPCSFITQNPNGTTATASTIPTEQQINQGMQSCYNQGKTPTIGTNYTVTCN